MAAVRTCNSASRNQTTWRHIPEVGTSSIDSMTGNRLAASLSSHLQTCLPHLLAHAPTHPRLRGPSLFTLQSSYLSGPYRLGRLEGTFICLQPPSDTRNSTQRKHGNSAASVPFKSAFRYTRFQITRLNIFMRCGWGFHGRDYEVFCMLCQAVGVPQGEL
jgi:hypothetical protein